MSEYWKDFRGDDSNLWQHEWSKHGTCVSTLETHCYQDYLPQQEVVDYFDRTVDVFKQVPSYQVRLILRRSQRPIVLTRLKFLANAGILPSTSRTYALEDIQDALERAHGAPVTVRCRYGSLNEIWYHFNVAGSLQTGKFVPAPPGMLCFQIPLSRSEAYTHDRRPNFKLPSPWCPIRAQTVSRRADQDYHD